MKHWSGGRVHRLALARIPRVLRCEQIATAPTPRPPRGWVFAEAPSAPAAYLDVVKRRIGRCDAQTRVPLDALEVDTRQDPLTPGLLDLDPAGTHALFCQCASPHGDARLCEVDFGEARVTQLYALVGPGWLAGAYVPGGVCVLEQRLGDECRFALYRLSRKRQNRDQDQGESEARAPVALWRSEGVQSPVLPLALSAELWLVLVAPTADPFTGMGATFLCALDVPSGTLTPLCPAEGHSLRTRRDAPPGARVLVDVVGEASTTRVELELPGGAAIASTEGG